MQVPAIVLYGYTSNARELWLSTGDSITREYNFDSVEFSRHTFESISPAAIVDGAPMRTIFHPGRSKRKTIKIQLLSWCVYPTQFFCSQTSGGERAFSITINVNCAERLCRISLARRRRRCCCSLIIYYETGSSSFQHL